MTRQVKTIALEKTNRELPIIKVKIRNRDRYFILDTGAEASLLAGDLIEDQPIVASGTMGGATAHTRRAYEHRIIFNLLGVTLNKAVGGEELMRRLSREDNGRDFGGLLGNDFLSKFSTVTFDYKKQVVRFEI